tara:strand:- start:7067 stop:8731 length:1665 start_codon:yes stop_codon:yes gene_type:complete
MFIIYLILIFNSSYVGYSDCASNSVVAKNLISNNGFKVDAVHYFFVKYPSLPRPEDTWPLLQPIFIGISYLLFGVGVVSAKIPNLLFFLILSILTYHISLNLFNRKVAYIAGFLILFNPYYLFSHYILFPYNDLGFTLLLLSSFYFFHKSIIFINHNKKRFYKYLFLTSIFATLSFLQKQPGLLLFIIIPFYLFIFNFKNYSKSIYKFRKNYFYGSIIFTIKSISIYLVLPFIAYILIKIREVLIKGYLGAYPYVIYVDRFTNVFSNPIMIFYDNLPNLKLAYLNFPIYFQTLLIQIKEWLINPPSILFFSFYLIYFFYIKGKSKKIMDFSNTFFNISFIFFLLHSIAIVFLYVYEYRYFSIYIPYICILAAKIAYDLYNSIYKLIMNKASLFNKKKLIKKIYCFCLLFLVLSFLISSLFISLPRINNYLDKNEILELHKFVDEKLPENSVILSRNEFALSFYTNQKVIGFPLLDYNQLIDLVKHYNITHIITTPIYIEFYTDSKILSLIKGKEINGFKKIHEMHNVYISSKDLDRSKKEIFIYEIEDSSIFLE